MHLTRSNQIIFRVASSEEQDATVSDTGSEWDHGKGTIQAVVPGEDR